MTIQWDGFTETEVARWRFVGIHNPRDAKSFMEAGIEFPLAELYEDREGMLGAFLDADGFLYTIDLLRMADSVRNHEGYLSGDRMLDVAKEWINGGFTPEEVGKWLDAECLNAQNAAKLRNAGITVAQARTVLPSTIGSGNYSACLAYKVACGNLSVDDAVKVLENRR